MTVVRGLATVGVAFVVVAACSPPGSEPPRTQRLESQPAVRHGHRVVE